MGNWDVDTDKSKNRLYLTLEGQLSIEEVKKAADAVIEAAEELDEGFDQVNDMSSFQPTDPEALEHIERGKRGIVGGGVAGGEFFDLRQLCGLDCVQLAGGGVCIGSGSEDGSGSGDTRGAEQAEGFQSSSPPEKRLPSVVCV
jgi:hypothetical protein